MGIARAAEPRKTWLATIDWTPSGALVVEAFSNVTDDTIVERYGSTDMIRIDAPPTSQSHHRFG